MAVDFAFYAITGTIVSESGHIDLSDTTDPKLKGISQPHAVNMLKLKPFTRRLRFGFDSNEESVFLEDSMYRSPGTVQVELVLDPSGSQGWIFFFEPNDPLLHEYRYRSSVSLWPGLLWFQSGFGSSRWCCAHRLTVLSEMLYSSPISLALRISTS